MSTTSHLRTYFARPDSLPSCRALALASVHMGKGHPCEALLSISGVAADAGDTWVATTAAVTAYAVTEMARMFVEEGTPPAEATFDAAYERTKAKLLAKSEGAEPVPANNVKAPTGVN